MQTNFSIIVHLFTVWAYKFLIPKYHYIHCMPCFGQHFCELIILSQVVVIEVESIKWSKKTNGIQRPQGGQVWALHGSFMHSNHSKLTGNTTGELSVKYQLTTCHSNRAMAIKINGANHPLVALKGSEKSHCRNHSRRKYRVEYDRVVIRLAIFFW